MLVWYFLLGALAVLAALLLFGFVGCGLDVIGTGAAAADYPTTISQTPGLVAYWRLQEPSSTPVPSSGGAAKCQNTPAFNGDYFKLNPTARPDEQHQSDQRANGPGQAEEAQEEVEPRPEQTRAADLAMGDGVLYCHRRLSRLRTVRNRQNRETLVYRTRWRVSIRPRPKSCETCSGTPNE